MKKLTLFIILFLINVSSSLAHALWIETKSTGKKGHRQEVKIFFGEYITNDIKITQKWFSNLSNFNLILTAPDGSKTTLGATADSLFFKTDFIPNQEGVYLLSIVHQVKDLYQNAKLQYYAFASVAVGEGVTLNKFYPNDASLTIRPTKVLLESKDTAIHQLIYNKTPLVKERITIVSPNHNKEEIETDKDGQFKFSPTEKGNYFLEAFAEDKTPGKFDQKSYEKTWHVVTYFTEIK